MKDWVFLLPPGWDASSSQGYPQHWVSQYPFIHLGRERGTARVKCHAPKHSTISPARAWTQTAWYLEMSTITMRPHTPTVHHSLAFYNFFFWSENLCRLQSCTTKTSFASHCKSLEIRLLDSQLKGRKWGNVCSTESFSNTPTIKEVSLTEIDSFSWLNVQE